MDRAIGWSLGCLIAAAAAIIGFIIWHEATEPDHGVITAKSHQASYLTEQCALVGKVMTCTPIFHPECWEIDYSDGGKTGDACVSEAAWRHYEIGAQYP